jgi:hypothetical protein
MAEYVELTEFENMEIGVSRKILFWFSLDDDKAYR